MSHIINQKGQPQMIACHNIQKSYKNNKVLHDINLQLNTGNIHVLLGTSGSGKSTLLNIITQLTPADSGTLKINQHNIHFPLHKQGINKPPTHPPIGMVFQHHNLWPHLNVLKNICLAPIKVLKHNKEDAEKQAISLLKQFNLASKAHAYPGQLSGGEQQRCALIRSLMLPYQAIALDEPTASLDPQSSQTVADALIQLKNQNKLLIVSTHDLQFAQAIADTVHLLQDGHIIESGSADSLSHPKTIQLKQYLNQTEE